MSQTSVVFTLASCDRIHHTRIALEKVGTPSAPTPRWYSSDKKNVTDLAEQIKQDFPNFNLILGEDYQISFKAKVRWKDTKKFLQVESLGEVYPSYTNAELERLVYRPSRVQDVHNGYDLKKHCVKTAECRRLGH